MFSTISNLFSPRNSDGPPGQAPHTGRAQSDAPDASPPQTVDGPACTPLSNQGATTETTQVTRSARSRFDLISLSESESRKIQEAYEYLQESACQDAVSPDAPVALNHSLDGMSSLAVALLARVFDSNILYSRARAFHGSQ